MSKICYIWLHFAAQEKKVNEKGIEIDQSVKENLHYLFILKFDFLIKFFEISGL